VLGDMLELGEHSREMHENSPIRSCESGVDRLYLAGPEMKVLADGSKRHLLRVRKTADALTDSVSATPHPGDVFMIKSSNGIGFSRIVKAAF
jgi:UDP-N-acetylmuramoyl-tripeptide--D-alanyl-D-alanine ligase